MEMAVRIARFPQDGGCQGIYATLDGQMMPT